MNYRGLVGFLVIFILSSIGVIAEEGGLQDLKSYEATYSDSIEFIPQGVTMTSSGRGRWDGPKLTRVFDVPYNDFVISVTITMSSFGGEGGSKRGGIGLSDSQGKGVNLNIGEDGRWAGLNRWRYQVCSSSGCDSDVGERNDNEPVHFLVYKKDGKLSLFVDGVEYESNKHQLADLSKLVLKQGSNQAPPEYSVTFEDLAVSGSCNPDQPFFGAAQADFGVETDYIEDHSKIDWDEFNTKAEIRSEDEDMLVVTNFVELECIGRLPVLDPFCEADKIKGNFEIFDEEDDLIHEFTGLDCNAVGRGIECPVDDIILSERRGSKVACEFTPSYDGEELGVSVETEPLVVAKYVMHFFSGDIPLSVIKDSVKEQIDFFDEMSAMNNNFKTALKAVFHHDIPLVVPKGKLGLRIFFNRNPATRYLRKIGFDKRWDRSVMYLSQEHTRDVCRSTTSVACASFHSPNIYMGTFRTRTLAHEAGHSYVKYADEHNLKTWNRQQPRSNPQFEGKAVFPLCCREAFVCCTYKNFWTGDRSHYKWMPPSSCTRAKGVFSVPGSAIPLLPKCEGANPNPLGGWCGTYELCGGMPYRYQAYPAPGEISSFTREELLGSKVPSISGGIGATTAYSVMGISAACEEIDPRIGKYPCTWPQPYVCPLSGDCA